MALDGLKEGFGDLFDAIRKIMPESIGGGYTEEEAKAIAENLEDVQGKTWGDTFKDIAGVEGNGFFFVAVILLVVMVLKD